jgi:hypothetical protein
LSPDLLAQARSFFMRSLDLDGSNDALVGTAAVDLMDAWSYGIDDPRSLMSAAEMKASQALTAAPNHPRAHLVMGSVLSATGRAARGIVELERALAIDPNFARAHGVIGLAQVFLGHAEATKAHVLEALRLSSRDTFVSNWFLHVVQRSLILANMRRRWRGSESRSTPIEAIRGPISIWPPVSPNSAGWTRREGR